MSKLQNRVLLYPSPIELTLQGYDLVHRAVLTTDHTLRVVLIVEPDRERARSLKLPEDFVECIRPLVEKINTDLPSEAQIAENHVLVAPAHEPFSTTAKGTVQRRVAVESYAVKIGKLSILDT